MSRFKSSIPLLALAYGLSAVANFLLSVVVGRRLGAAALGDFAFAVAVSRIFYAGLDLGLAAHLTRVVSRDRGASQEFTSLFAAFRVLVIAAGVLLVSAVGASRGQTLASAPVAVALGIVSLQGVFEALLLAHDRQPDAATLTVVTSLCVGGASAAWFLARGTLLEFTAAYALASVVSITAWWAWCGRTLAIWPRLRIDRPRLQAELRKSWPIGISMFLGIAALRAPVLALGWFTSSADVGAFSAVDMFVTAAAILQAAVSSATYPKLAASYRKDPPRFRRMFWASNLALAVIGVLTATFLAFFGEPIISAVFAGRGFHATAGLVRVIAWSSPSLLLVHHNIIIFAAADHERRNLRLMAAWFVVIAGFQLALVPGYGLLGAAWGVLVGRLVGLGVLVAAIAAARLHRGGDDH